MRVSMKWALIGAVSAAVLAVAACSKPEHAGQMAQHGDNNGMQMATIDTLHPAPAEYVENFRLIDHKGESHELFYHANAKAVVIMTQGNGCPIVRNAMPDLEALKTEFEKQGVVFYLLNSNPQDSREELAKEANEFNINIPILKDTTQLIGEAMGVDRTAMVYVLDPAQNFKTVYAGPVNDRQTYERQRATAGQSYVKDALTQMVAGEDVSVEAPSQNPGCLINFPARKNQEELMAISYTKDVAPILKNKCVECHQEGGIGPWAMTDYDTVSGWAPMMRQVIRTDRMPPWHADPEIGKFHGDRSLTDDEIKTIVHWVEADAPRGEGEDPLAGLNLHAPEWPLGEPDLILTLPAFTVPANGVVDYEYPVIANPLTEDKWLKATTVKAGDRRVVHHVLSGYMSEMPETGKGSTSRWEFSTGGYAVGAESNIAPDDSGTPFPAGGAIGFQMHYTPFGKEVTDVTQIGFYFQDKPHLLNRSSVIIDASISIPPGEAEHKETAYMEFPYDAELLSAFPHAHYRGRASSLRIRYPDGKEEQLLSLPRYDFNWQRAYEFETPVKVPAGSKLIADYIYDNSADNLANPDPSAVITWGEQSFEEMLYTSLSYRWVGETTDNRLDHQQDALRASRFFTALDDDMDGKLVEADLKGMMGARMKPGFPYMDADKDGTVTLDEYIAFNKARAARGQQ